MRPGEPSSRWIQRFLTEMARIQGTCPLRISETSRYHSVHTAPEMYRLGATAVAAAWAAHKISEEYARCRCELCVCREYDLEVA